MNTVEQLKVLYREMSEHTAPECAKCRLPHSCCSAEYCEIARGIAKAWGIELVDTGHPRLPFMGPSGCIVEPYLRPLCTLHTCEINSIGIKRGDPKWTERYFDIRAQIEEIEIAEYA